MRSRKTALLCTLAAALLANTLGPAGCTIPKDPYNLVDPYETADKPNNTFGTASVIPLTNNAATIQSLLTTHDVDVYNLGPAAAGDRLIVDVEIPDRVLLNAAVGIFDSVGRMFYLNAEPTQMADVPLTDANFPAFAPHFEFVVRQATAPLYLAIASLPEPEFSLVPGSPSYGGYTAGQYSLRVAFQRNGPIPQPVKQIVAIQFDDTTVAYPPMETFGQWSQIPPQTFAGMNGMVLDPAWWRPFIIMRIGMDRHRGDIQFWTDFLTFVNNVAGGTGNNVAGINIPNLQNILPDQVWGLLNAEMNQAIPQAVIDPTNFTPADLQWFRTRGFVWLFLFGSYLGPGITTAQQGQNQTFPGLNVWGAVLAAGYPTVQDPAYSDSLVLRETVRSQLSRAYAGLNIEFRIVGQDLIPTNTPVGRVYFVSNSLAPGLLGLSSTIDIGNQNPSDFSTIFGGELGFNNALALGLGQANAGSTAAETMGLLGFVGSHELGHTLGLVHTSSSTDIMKTSGGSVADLDATFGAAPLDSSVFPIGTQDAYLLLLLQLGFKP